MQRHELIGWVLFTFSALFFVATSVRAGDMLGLLGGLLFLIACFFFMAPLGQVMRARKSKG